MTRAERSASTAGPAMRAIADGALVHWANFKNRLAFGEDAPNPAARIREVG